jgi:hypothetical protein
MKIKNLSRNDKKHLFKFIAHQAILAGREMSPVGYEEYNAVVYTFLLETHLIEDFKTLAKEAALSAVSIMGEC